MLRVIVVVRVFAELSTVVAVGVDVRVNAVFVF
jgi:hypothetical protein